MNVALSGYAIGVTVGTLAFPAAGLTLLIVGLVQRSRSLKELSRWHAGYPGPVAPHWQPQHVPLPGYGTPPPAGYPGYRPPPSGYPPRPTPRGGGFVAAGLIILALLVLSVASRAGQSMHTSSSAVTDRPSVVVNGIEPV